MSDRAKYSRTYWRVLSDPEFEGIRDNPTHFGSWSLMLLSADMAWPTVAYVPPMVPRRSLEALVGAGLIELMTGGRYALRGIDKERNARRVAATRDPDGTQLGPKRDPDGVVAKQSKDKQSKEADEQAPERVGDTDPADTYWALTGRFPTEKTLTWIDQMGSQFGGPAVSKALATAFIADKSTQTLLGRTQDRLRAEARELDRKEREAEQVRLREKRAQPRVLEPWQEEYRAAIQRQYEDVA